MHAYANGGPSNREGEEKKIKLSSRSSWKKEERTTAFIRHRKPGRARKDREGKGGGGSFLLS